MRLGYENQGIISALIHRDPGGYEFNNLLSEIRKKIPGISKEQIESFLFALPELFSIKKHNGIELVFRRRSY